MADTTLWLAMVFLFVGSGNLRAQGVTIIELGEVQRAKSLAAVVKDAGSFPLPDVLVNDMSADWKKCLRSTKTDSSGRFSLKTLQGKKIYYLELTCDGFNPLRVRIQVDAKGRQNLQLQMTPST